MGCGVSTNMVHVVMVMILSFENVSGLDGNQMLGSCFFVWLRFALVTNIMDEIESAKFLHVMGSGRSSVSIV